MKIKVLYFAVTTLVLIIPSCVTKSLKECRDESTKLNNDLQDRIKYIEAIEQKSGADIARLKGQNDSLSKEVQTLKELSPEGLIRLRDSLQNAIGLLKKRNEDITARNVRLADTLGEFKSILRSNYELPGNKGLQITCNNHTYDCYTVDIKQTDLQFYWKDPQGKPIQSLANLAKVTEQKGKRLVFATNAGMYKPDRSPQGLFIQNGKMLVPADRRQEEFGNFYMQPNGVFLIDTNSIPGILTTEQFDEVAAKKVRFATQSGPMVVINGEINSKFKINSENLNIRSGVGIIDSNRVVFVISNQPVNFYDFASVFKNEFKCANALYLDGAISEMFLPEVGRLQKGGSFGPIIGILKQ